MFNPSATSARLAGLLRFDSTIQEVLAWKKANRSSASLKTAAIRLRRESCTVDSNLRGRSESWVLVCRVSGGLLVSENSEWTTGHFSETTTETRYTVHNSLSNQIEINQIFRNRSIFCLYICYFCVSVPASSWSANDDAALYK